MPTNFRREQLSMVNLVRYISESGSMYRANTKISTLKIDMGFEMLHIYVAYAIWFAGDLGH